MKSREELFASSEHNELLSFYQSFSTFAEFRDFFESRGKAEVKVVHKAGRENLPIVAVVPTASIDGVLAKSFSSHFPEIDVVFVESQGPRFNFSHSMNIGIREALTLGKKWIMLSNDDVKPSRPISHLLKKLEQSEPRRWYKPLMFSENRQIPTSWILCRLPRRGVVSALWDLTHRGTPESSSTYHLIRHFARLFGLSPIVAVQTLPLQSLTDKVVSMFRIPGTPRFLNVQPLAVLDSEVISRFSFDESFVNACEDMDLSWRLANNGCQGSLIDYRVETAGSASLGRTRARWLRYGLSGRLLFAGKFGRALT